MFKEQDRTILENIASEEVKKEGRLVSFLIKMFPIILRLAERIAEKFLEKKGWI